MWYRFPRFRDWPFLPPRFRDFLFFFPRFRDTFTFQDRDCSFRASEILRFDIFFSEITIFVSLPRPRFYYLIRESLRIQNGRIFSEFTCLVPYNVQRELYNQFHFLDVLWCIKSTTCPVHKVEYMIHGHKELHWIKTCIPIKF